MMGVFASCRHVVRIRPEDSQSRLFCLMLFQFTDFAVNIVYLLALHEALFEQDR